MLEELPRHPLIDSSASGLTLYLRAELLIAGSPNRTKRGIMRSQLVYSAGIQIPNRFLLATVTMKAVQRLHITTTRTEDTANRVFTEVAQGRFVEVTLPEIAPQVSIEPLLVAPAA
jgi:hypothetical protein